MSWTCTFNGGNTGCILSKIWGRNISLSSSEINNYTLLNYIPIWDMDTYILSFFNDTIESGSISSDIGAIEKILIYQREQESELINLLTEIDVTNNEYYDFTNLDNNIYQYILFVQGVDGISQPILSNTVESDYYGWYLIDVENNKAYQLDIDFDGGNKSYIEDFTEYETNNNTNIFTRGGNFYIQGSIKSILSKDNLKSDIINTNQEISDFRDFINSTRTKYLKSRRGEIFKVITSDYKEIPFNNKLGNNIYSVSFNFREVGDV